MKPTIRADKDFSIDAWIDFFRASDFNQWWTHRHADAALSYSYLVITAWSDEQIVGTVRVLSDGVNAAEIEDVIVHPAFRRQGIGSRMMREALDRLLPLNLDFIQLKPMSGRESFFERFGFEVQTGATVMDLPKPAT